MAIRINPGDQVFIRGDKKSGKTALCMAYAGDQSLVVLDPKHERDEWLAYARHHMCVVTRDPADVLRFPRVVVLVDQLWLDDREGWKRPGTEGWNWTLTLDNIWQRRNTIVVFEEALQTLPSSGANPRARRILTQGRVPQLTSLVTIQVTNWVDTLGPRLAEHYISFACNDDTELAEIKARRGPYPQLLRDMDPASHDFAYHARGAQGWLYCRHLPEDFVRSLTHVHGRRRGAKKGADVQPEEPSQEIEEEPE